MARGRGWPGSSGRRGRRRALAEAARWRRVRQARRWSSSRYLRQARVVSAQVAIVGLDDGSATLAVHDDRRPLMMVGFPARPRWSLVTLAPRRSDRVQPAAGSACSSVPRRPSGSVHGRGPHGRAGDDDRPWTEVARSWAGPTASSSRRVARRARHRRPGPRARREPAVRSGHLRDLPASHRLGVRRPRAQPPQDLLHRVRARAVLPDDAPHLGRGLPRDRPAQTAGRRRHPRRARVQDRAGLRRGRHLHRRAQRAVPRLRDRRRRLLARARHREQVLRHRPGVLLTGDPRGLRHARRPARPIRRRPRTSSRSPSTASVGPRGHPQIAR